MDKILRGFETLGLNEQIALFSNDEIVFDVTDKIKTVGGFRMSDFLWAKGITEEVRNVSLKLEAFQLYKIMNTDGYLKRFIDSNSAKEYEFKCLNNYMLPFAMRHILNEKVTDSDKVFYHEGLLAQFVEVPKIEIRGVV